MLSLTPTTAFLLYTCWCSSRSLALTSLPNFISRRTFFMRTALLSTTTHMMAASTSAMGASISLLDSVYGPVDSPLFPLPLPADEAGLCADGRQRRYLWTDAFGVLSYISIAKRYEKNNKLHDAQKYTQAANTLIDVVHECLGKPRSSSRLDAMSPSTVSPTGYIGLRIGKVDTRQVTDYGMHYDGQYWHYIDKWLLALSRCGRNEDATATAKSVFPAFFDAGPYGTGHQGGIRWKVSVDGTPPPSLQRAQASDDGLVALIVFSMLQQQQQQQQHGHDDAPADLTEEIRLLRASLENYRPRVTDDPLGWGLEALYDEYLEGHPRRTALARHASSALDYTAHMSLPFRLYGAILGARTADIGPSTDGLLEKALVYERRAQASGCEEHSSINRVMLAMSLLCPGSVLDRRPEDPLIRL
mmetsp:Transcript_19040/g.38480  ORF Transcript_19040/g.38480 Transcript_19040/m.38480 type:complete len:416 (-) Transcript_19040:146-1393(-)